MTSAWVVAKEKGNTLFKGQSYLAAIEAYTEAISLHGQESAAAASSTTEDASSPPPTTSRSDLAPLYSNRAVSHYKLGEYASAEADARRALDADPQFLRAYSRLGAALCGLGRFAAAAEVYLQGATEAARKKDRNLEAELRANAADATSVSQAMDAGRSALDGGVAAAGTPAGTPVTPLSPVAPMSPTTLATAGRLVGEAYLRHPTCPPLALMYAELQASVDPEAGTRVLARLGRGAAVDGTPDPRDAAAAEAAANRNLQNNPEYFYVRALTAYHAQASTTATAQAILREALSVDPDHGKSQRLLRRIRSLEAQKEAGNKAYKERNWKAAEEAYTNALNADASNKRLAGVLYGNRSAARLEGGNVAGALEDVNQALARGNESAKLYARRARIFEQQDKWTEAKSDLQKAAELDEENYGGRAMHDFDERMRVAKRKDYYKILGVAKGATDEDLKRAYRKAALQWHPDKWANSSQEEKSAAEAAFKDVQEAHSMLSDPQKRRLYDSGRMDNETEGVRGPGGGHGHGFPPGGVDISQMFSMFGGMPMGGMGGMGGMSGMGGMGSGRRRGGGMPAGFQFGF